MTHTPNTPHEDEVRADQTAETGAADTVSEAEQATESTDAPQATEPEQADEPQGPTFIDLGLDARVLTAIEELGYTAPSPIQEQTIPLILDGLSLIHI